MSIRNVAFAVFAFAILAATSAGAEESRSATRQGAAEVPAGSPAGVWVGEYSCAQGVTGAKLTLRDLGGGKLEGEFSFYAKGSNPDVPSGSFEVSGTYAADSAGIKLVPGAWIERPKDYTTIGFFGPMPEDGLLALGIDHPGCDSFVARHSGDVSGAGKQETR